MTKKRGFLAVAGMCLLVAAAAGCETAKGTARGVGVAGYCVANGMKKDCKGAGNFVQRTDSWIRKNLW